jgi:hypothetical protein
VQEVGTPKGNSQTLHATVHVANITNEGMGKIEGTWKKGSDPYKKVSTDK